MDRDCVRAKAPLCSCQGTCQSPTVLVQRPVQRRHYAYAKECAKERVKAQPCSCQGATVLPPRNAPRNMPNSTSNPSYSSIFMSSSSHISVEDFYAFHTIDRELFTRLVIDLRRDPGYSILSLALFLWFDNIGFPDVVVKLRSLPDAVVDVVGEEATIILRYLEMGTLPPSAQPNALENLIPTIRGLMDSRLTFQFLQEQRIRVLYGVSQFMEDVCSRAFVDIVQRLAVVREREAASTSVGHQPFVMPTNFGVRPPVVPPMAPAVPLRYVVVQDPIAPQIETAPMNKALRRKESAPCS
ncbi:hypothetical protein Syun_031228 [Stephania yunnanensis]|uniref:Uncharacterized protein n=1 Tax=Stephania yunnanensis TaxID=152371 RepID=A0AAP0E001_9MAGN